MRSSLYVCASLAALCASIAPAAATITISKQPTQNMTCSAGVCSPTAVDARLNVQDLEAMLASGNATVTTTGGGVEADSIVIGARLTWSTANLLRLQAVHSIKIDRPVTVAGTGGVWLIANNGASGSGFSCSDTGRLQFSSLSSALIIANTSYTLVNSVASLAAAIAANPSGAFALAKDYNAKKDGTYTSSPIGTVFNGSFSGLGNTISNLSINDPTENANVGLFAELSGASIANVRLTNETVVGGSGSSDTTGSFIGGLVGAGGGTIANSTMSGSVSGGTYVSVGGLVGFGAIGVANSGASATVSISGLGNAGVLVGGTTSAVNDSYATGTVSGIGFVGGLVGFDSSPSIKSSWASATVSSSDTSTYVGGLVGINQSGTIERSHASGNVTCAGACGGLVGFEGGGYASMPNVSQSFATGSVSANAGCSGGLVGLNELGEISNSYATGGVTAPQAGGLVCQNVNIGGYHAISDSYSTGVVTGQSGSTGGLLGGDEFTSTLKRNYWDTTTSGITDLSQGAGNVANDPGITGLSNSQLKSGLPKGFSSRIWSENPNINSGLPYLIANPPAS